VPRSRGFRSGRVPQRRSASWEVGPGQVGAQSNFTVSGSILVAQQANVVADGLTLVRLRGRLQIFLSAATAVQNGFAGAFGIAVATTAAVTAGAASVPTPITEQDWEGWLFWTPIILRAPEAIAGNVSSDLSGISAVTAVTDMIVDSKAMRKLSDDMSIFGVMELTELGTATALWNFDSRVLVKLP